jgi:hypothetical protein
MKIMGLKRVKVRQLVQYWPALVALLVLTGLLWFKLGSLPVAGSVSQPEADVAFVSSSAHRIVDTAQCLPQTALQYVLERLAPVHTITALRLASTLFAIVAVASMLYVIRRWYGQRVVLFALAVLCTSAAVLHIGRLGSVDVLYLSAIPLLLAAHVALHQKPSSRRIFAGWLLVNLFLLYIPGMVWFVLLQAVWQRSELLESIKQFTTWWHKAVLGVSVLLGLLPLGYGFFKNQNYDYLLTWFGLPTAMPGIDQVGKNIAASILAVTVRSPLDPARTLGHLPALSAVLLVCFLAGLLFYVRHLRAERTQLLLSVAVVSLVLLGLGGAVTRSLLTPLAYLVAFGGLAYILHYWLKLFPVNPFARRLGIGIVIVAVSLSCVYNIRQYFVAWPHNPDTKAAFTIPLGDS